jgi:sugar/nucleoside kinase (ribokinase family)
MAPSPSRSLKAPTSNRAVRFATTAAAISVTRHGGAAVHAHAREVDEFAR